MFSSSKPYTAVTVQIDRLTSEEYDADDMSGIPDLIEVIRIQSAGPTEAARGVRKKLKYGSVHQQLRGLTVLDGLMENAGQRFQRSFADEMLLERLRVCATDSLSDDKVKRKCQILFRQWAVEYRGTPGMERIVTLEKQLPKRKKPATQQQSRVLRETEPNPNEDPFSTEEDDEDNEPTPSLPSFTPISQLTSQPIASPSTSAFGFTSSKPSKKSKSDKSPRKSKSRRFDLEKEKPQILQTIASAQIASTNLFNALKLIDREHKRVSEDVEAQQRFEVCKQLRRQVLRYIQRIESEQWLGSLIHANDALVEALMAFEILDKSIEDDSDSDAEWQSAPKASESPPPMPTRPSQSPRPLHEGFAGLSMGSSSAESTRRSPPPPQKPMSLSALKHHHVDPAGESEDNDPFADSNEVDTPRVEKSAPQWRDV